MKRLFVLILYFVLTVFIVPLIVFYVSGMQHKNEKIDLSEELKASDSISVYFHDEDKVKSMPIDEYLCGVVSAEMPASFEYEALKAQAVAARSFALYRKKENNDRHPSAAVCTDYTHCKAYKTQEQLNEIWGEDAKKNTQKIQSAVLETSGEIITYNGDVALAVFHSQAGGGRTENSEDVWGGNVPYLVSVESHGEETAPNFYSQKKISFEEFKKIIKSNNPSAKVNSADDIGKPEISEGGSVKTIIIGGESFKGKDIRSMFDLRSNCFKISVDNDTVTFEVTGYGHGVGMSQYGANTMAKEGYSYKDILTHYYSGTKIEGV